MLTLLQNNIWFISNIGVVLFFVLSSYQSTTNDVINNCVPNMFIVSWKFPQDFHNPVKNYLKKKNFYK